MSTLKELKKKYHAETLATLIQTMNEDHDVADYYDDVVKMTFIEADLKLLAKELNVDFGELLLF